MIKFAVIGDPIAHSLSPVMQNAALQALGIPAVYEAVRVPLEELETFAKHARMELAGFNITVPHKKHILPFLDSVSKEAALAESVNTVIVKDGKLFGESTDGYGLETALHEELGFSIRGQKTVFLGCGGAAHAAVFRFAGQGASEIAILNRTLDKAQALAAKIRENFPGVRTAAYSILDRDQIREAMEHAGAVIQCTSLGLKPEDPAPIPEELLPDGVCYYDTIYKPTKLFLAAKAKGLPCGAGLGMLLYQGARSLELWTGRPAPVEVMRQALNRGAHSSSAHFAMR